MKLSEKGFAFIRKEEGEVLTSYKDQVGLWTVGIGHCGAPAGPGVKITAEKSRELFDDDAARVVGAVNALAGSVLTQAQFDALVSFGFNVGLGGLSPKSSTLARKLRDGNFAVGAEFEKWVRGGGKVLPVLVARRKRERKLWETGDYGF